MVVIDTNIIIDHLRQKNDVVTPLRKLVQSKTHASLAISIVTVQELYGGKSTRDADKEKLLLATVAPLKILSYTYEIAELAGTITRDRKQSVELADAAIAATAIINNAELFTLNKKNFSEILELQFYEYAET